MVSVDSRFRRNYDGQTGCRLPVIPAKAGIHFSGALTLCNDSDATLAKFGRGASMWRAEPRSLAEGRPETIKITPHLTPLSLFLLPAEREEGKG